MLFQADMMEGFGERMKRAADSKFLAKKDIEPGYAVGNDIATGKYIYRWSHIRAFFRFVHGRNDRWLDAGFV